MRLIIILKILSYQDQDLQQIPPPLQLQQRQFQVQQIVMGIDLV